MAERHLRTVAVLGTTQTLAWASTYYLPAVLAPAMARELGTSVPTVFAAFSCALVLSALLGPYAGRAIDRWGGRPVLAVTNVVFAIGLGALSVARGPIELFAAWLVLGIGMGSGLYEAAFATLVRLYGANARASITGITLIAGFASTVGWPLSTLLEAQLGWRGACLTWAGLHLLLGMPLNALLPKLSRAKPVTEHHSATANESVVAEPPRSRRTAITLAFVFGCVWFISTAMAAHMPLILQAGGVGLAAAVAASALIGPAQAGARMLEYALLRRFHPLIPARLATLMHPLGALAFMAVGAPAAAAFTVLHGAGNGILTISSGTLPLALFGAGGYGQRQGLLIAPARLAQATAPWLFGLCLSEWGAAAVWLTALLSLAALIALLSVPHSEHLRKKAAAERAPARRQ